MQKGIAGALTTVTGTLNRVAADEVEQANGLWLASREDIDGMAEPASRLAYRRMPEGATGNRELFDVLDLVLAVGGYIFQNLQLRSRIRAARMLAEMGADPDPGTP